MSSASEVDAVIVGAGVSGLYQLHKLRDLGLRVRVIEAGSGVGGTWYWSRYPGARCDIESTFYSYSFSRELEQEWTWTEKFITQPELLRYVNHVADRFDLRKDITLNTRVTSAVYDESAKRWEVHTDSNETITTQFLVMATGVLSVPKMPEIPGIANFRGRAYHTAQWPDQQVDFTGLRVGVIGTGSSAIQCIPIIAQQAAKLTVFQRTPAFCLPAHNRLLTDQEIAHTKANYPALRDAERNSRAGIPADPPTQSALAASDAANFIHLISAYNDTMLNKDANETVCEFVREKIRSIVRNPKTAESLSPRSYAFGTKRVCLESGYYDAFNADHVHLVELPIVEITPSGIRTSEGEHYDLDVIVYATGYDAVTGALNEIDVRGKGGVALRAKWADGPRTYLGLAVAGFPNLFMVTGPQTPSVFTNMTAAIEQHVDWIAECVAFVRREGAAEIDAAADAEEAWVAHASAVAAPTLYAGALSWYMGSNVPNKPRVLLGYLGGFDNYTAKCNDVAAHGYQGFVLTPA
jgi:cation diffusion facilitator CzcD-associated flavoprotein CzcO